MKKFVQSAVLIAGLAACASDNTTDYQGRTAGHMDGKDMKMSW